MIINQKLIDEAIAAYEEDSENYRAEEDFCRNVAWDQFVEFLVEYYDIRSDEKPKAIMRSEAERIMKEADDGFIEYVRQEFDGTYDKEYYFRNFLNESPAVSQAYIDEGYEWEDMISFLADHPELIDQYKQQG